MINLNETRDGISRFLESMSKGLEKGRFKFCSDGSLAPTLGKQAQVSTCFAMKAAWQSGVWENWDKTQKLACVNFIKSFQNEQGDFYDEWTWNNTKFRISQFPYLIFDWKNWRSIININRLALTAETRQSTATLLMVDEKPKRPLPVQISNPNDVLKFVSMFDWTTPWGAGSHLSHQMMFLATNKKIFGIDSNYDAIINKILEFLESIRDDNTGAWFRGNPKSKMIINGAMKILSGLQWIEVEYPDCKKLLDFALEREFESDGCGFLNRLFVINESLKGAPENYRQNEVEAIALRALKEIVKFRNQDGAFSFWENKAQTSYYGAKVSQGLPISDLHGTSMMAWAIALCASLLKENALEGAEMWKPNKA